MLAGVELGGTKCVCTLGTGPDDVRAQATVPTTSPDVTLSAIVHILAGWDYRSLGIASFGPLELDRAAPQYGRIVSTTKTGWNGADLTMLARGLPFALDTDVNGAALAEGRWGAAQGLDSWAYITVGTGIGVGSVAAGQILRGAGHSEAGHQRVPKLAGDPFAGCCSYHGDCVEGLASGPAIAARAGRDGREIAPDDVVWGYAAHAIAMLCHNLVLTTLPQRILIGGGVAMGQPQLLTAIRRQLDESLAGYGRTGSMEELVQLPGLGERAGPCGSLALASMAGGQAGR